MQDLLKRKQEIVKQQIQLNKDLIEISEQIISKAMNDVKDEKQKKFLVNSMKLAKKGELNSSDFIKKMQQQGVNL